MRKNDVCTLIIDFHMLSFNTKCALILISVRSGLRCNINRVIIIL